MKNLNYVRIASASNIIYLGNPNKTAKEMIDLINKAEKENVELICFPELSLLGQTVGDMFLNKQILSSCLDALKSIVENSINKDIVSVIPCPIEYNSSLYNAAVVIQNGKILGISTKHSLQGNGDKLDKRYFKILDDLKYINILDQKVVIGEGIIYRCDDFSFCVEIGEDIKSLANLSYNYVANGTDVILNPTAVPSIVSKQQYVHEMLASNSRELNTCFVYSSSGYGESTGNSVYDGYCAIYENGAKLAETKRYSLDSELCFNDIDIDSMKFKRLRSPKRTKDITFKVEYINFEAKDKTKIDPIRHISKYPFLPNALNKETYFEEIYNIQVMGLLSRMKKIGIKNMVLGLSGGLDSCLSFLVCLGVAKALGYPNTNIHALLMPGLGTSSKTKNNALQLAKECNCTYKTIDIKESVLLHFKDIGHNENTFDTTYENCQARERTQILMDYANMVNALVIGTGDMSEMALGFCTYNGDHMSMYNVNGSITKTLMRPLVDYVSKKYGDNINRICKEIINTPVSPELLPAKENEISQKTEEILGSYNLHDFFLFHLLSNGASKDKLFSLAKYAFKDDYNDEYIKKTLQIFLKRFFTQQFKRNCAPDCPKIGSISLSSHAAFIMPSDMDSEFWNI